MLEPQNIFPHLPQRISGLGAMAENLWWSWNPAARMLFKMLDRQAWKESVHNPDKMLKELPKTILEAAARHPDYRRQYDAVMSRFREYMEEKPCPLLPAMPDPGISKIAYFSAEYGLHRSLPFYAGGLGFLAGDHLKECSDLNVPLVAVGFMYPEGYLYQQIRDDGWQENITEKLEREEAAISKVFNADGTQLTVAVPMIQPPIHVAVWRVDVGRVPLYLMDTDIEANDPWNRGISARLYTGDLEQRLRQEIVLGIGGAEVLETLGIKRFLMHLNEGHAAFALLEQIRARIHQGLNFAEALERVRNTTIFTTHTPVAAGHDVFPFQIIFAGKAHPADDPGKQILQRIFNACRDPNTGGRIAFVEDYGEQLAQYLVHGVDVWLNTPIPPMEASGTSGMKAALNGVPQLSIMDGWWLEGYNGKNGWAIDHQTVDGHQDAADAADIYRTLEEEIIPLYYDVSEAGVPHGWVKLMKASIRSNAAQFSARRMVKEYVEKFYASALNKL